MKILKVTLENLASYDGRYTIDFTKEPLKSAGLYSIVGPTGSGKSTILDAICLALYGTAPRFDNATKLAYFDNTEQHRKERDKILPPEDTRNILRKGAKEGRAEVEFIANDGTRYRAVWYVKYGRTQYGPRERSLLKYTRQSDGTETEEELYRRNGNSPLFQQVIGLDYEQFTRTIMLAQNSFANFIKCDGKEKAKLLERLTGTEIYTRIAERINAHFKEAQQQLKEFNLLIEADKRDLLSDEEAADCHAQLEASQTKIKQAENESKTIDRQIDWLHRKHNALSTLQKDLQLSEQKQKEWKDHEMEEKQLDVYNRLTSISPVYGNLSQTTRDLYTSQQELTRAQTTIEKAVLEQKNIQKHFDDSTKECATAQKAVDELRPLLKEARGIRSVISVKEKDLDDRRLKYTTLQEKVQTVRNASTDNLNNQKKVGLTLNKAEESLKTLQRFELPIRQVEVLLKSLSQLKETYEKISTDKHKAEEIRTALNRLKTTGATLKVKEETQKKDYDTTCTILRQQEEALKKMDGPALRKATSEAKDRMETFAKAAQCWVDYFREAQRVITLRKDVELYERQVAKLKKTDLELTRKRQGLEKQLPGLQTAFQLLVGENSEKMRASLKDNTPCPVCGALHHPYADGHAADSATLLLRKELEDKQKQKEQTEKEQTAVREKLSGESGILAHKKDELKTATENLPVIEADWKAMTKLDASLTENIAAEDKVKARMRYEFLKAEQAKATTLHEESQKAEERFSELESACTQTRQRKDKQLALWQNTEKEYNQIQLELARKEQEQNGLEHQLKEIQENEAAIILELDSYGLENNWKELWQANASGYVATWEQRAQTWQQATMDKEQADSELKSLKATYEALQQQEKETESLFKEVQKAYLDAKDELQKLEKKLNAFWNGKQPDEVEEEAGRHLQETQKKHEDLTRQLNEANVAVEKSQAVAKGKEERLTQLHQQKETLLKTIQKWLEQSELSITFEKLAWYLSKERDWAHIRSMLTTQKEELKELEGRIKAEQTQLEAIEKDEKRTEKNENELLEQQQILQTTIEQEKRSQNEWLVKIENDNKSRKRLEKSAKEAEKLQQTYNNWSELNKLMGANQGDDIRQAAQCYTLQFLVAHANRQLKMLTSRYRLVQVPDSLSLRIKDMDYAGEERNISSLSGGETFLVSLSLALGLSAISSGNHNYGMLFIDEGFGTLDQESLNTVIDALSSLQSIQGKKVGVISHTAEMRERIPVQIQVIKGNTEGKSRLRIV